MASTIFHRVKFDLPKAFYIVYYTFEKKGNINVSELSRMLDLRNNTTWKFANRVVEHLQSMPDQDVNEWTDLVDVGITLKSSS